MAENLSLGIYLLDCNTNYDLSGSKKPDYLEATAAEKYSGRMKHYENWSGY